MADRTGAVPELILASASAGRAAVLRQAGLSFRQAPANIDERAIEEAATRDTGEPDAGEIALKLAAAKAEQVSRAKPSAIVIGADQLMSCGGVLYHKPQTMDAARHQLRSLRGRTHSLFSGLCVARAGATVWRHLARADLTMRDFSDDFLEDYCRAEDAALFQSVGCYRIEGRGIQLFSAIEGDHFTIIGLPLLPLLGYLRQIGWLAG